MPTFSNIEKKKSTSNDLAKPKASNHIFLSFFYMISNKEMQNLLLQKQRSHIIFPFHESIKGSYKTSHTNHTPKIQFSHENYSISEILLRQVIKTSDLKAHPG